MSVEGLRGVVGVLGTASMTFPVERLVKQTHRPVSMGAAFSNVPSSDISAINPSPIRLFDFLDSPVGVLEVFGGGWSNPIFPSAAI